MAPTLRATTFRNSEQSFLETLDSHGIKYNRLIPPMGGAKNAGLTIEILLSRGWAVIAVAILAWANVQESREITVTTKDGTVVWLKGYSADEATKILESEPTQLLVIDTTPPKPRKD